VIVCVTLTSIACLYATLPMYSSIKATYALCALPAIAITLDLNREQFVNRFGLFREQFIHARHYRLTGTATAGAGGAVAQPLAIASSLAIARETLPER